MGSFPENYNDPAFLVIQANQTLSVSQGTPRL